MKYLLIALSFMSFASLAQAQSLTMATDGPTQDTVERTKENISSFVMSMSGVNGISTAACEQNSGASLDQLSEEQLKSAKFVYCIEILTETPLSNDALSILYSAGTKISGDVFVTHKTIGVVHTL